MKIGASQGCKSTGSKHRGILYHRRVYDHLRRLVTLGLPDWQLLVEPWYRKLGENRFRQPDAVLLYPEESIGIVVEVKLNWKDGRDIKLIDEYLPIVKSAEGLEVVYPLLITQCLRGWKGQPILQLARFTDCQSWQPGDVTPLMMLP